jgi:hypothetical protein
MAEYSPEWEVWAEEALKTEEAAEYRALYAKGLTEEELEEEDYAIDQLVLGRMSSFCEVCMQKFVPGQGAVTWFEKPFKVGNNKLYSACTTCMQRLDKSVPEVLNKVLYHAWAVEALKTEEAASIRANFADILTGDSLANTVLARMSAFCEVCDGHFIPYQGTVSWFKEPVLVKGRRLYSACTTCMQRLDTIPEVLYTA